ncbi:MAG: hypothetical protein AAGB35_04210, partial [Pseudomonadota bacterium]
HKVKLNYFELEDSMWKYVRSQTTSVFDNRSAYAYQFKINGENMMINAICYFEDPSELVTDFVTRDDDGTCNFQVNYNLESKEFSSLRID